MPRPRRSEDLIIRAARLRYEQRLPQTEIARILDISESTVSRCLRTALDLGYVEIQVAPKAFRNLELEARLQRALGLTTAVVVDDRPSPAQALETLGKAVARVLEDLVKPGDVIGVSDGVSVAAVAFAARRSLTQDLDVVSLVGGVGAPEEPSHSSEVCRRLAAGLGARAWQLPVPAIVDDDPIASVLHETGTVRSVFALMRRVTIALVGVGAISPSATIFRHGLVDNALTEKLIQSGAVGTICARFFGREGQPVGTAFDNRTMSIALKDLAHVPVRIAVAASETKVPAIAAAVGGGLINAIATDASTAEALLLACQTRPG